MSTNVYITVTRGDSRVVVTGELDLLRKILFDFTEKESDPAPVILPNPDNPLISHAQPQKAV